MIRFCDNFPFNVYDKHQQQHLAIKKGYQFRKFEKIQKKKIENIF